MRTRHLGDSGPELTTVGFGSWAVGGPWRFGWGAVDDDESVAAIRQAVELGVNWVDTAAVYGLGHSEEIVGRALAPIASGKTCSCSRSADGDGKAVRTATSETTCGRNRFAKSASRASAASV